LQTPANIVTEIDSLYMLIGTIKLGRTATIQPGAVLTLVHAADTRCIEITDANVGRRNLLVSLSDNELSPVALATRVTIARTVRQLVREHSWMGATLLEA
jgi:LysR family tcuABC transcriptional regulator